MCPQGYVRGLRERYDVDGAAGYPAYWDMPAHLVRAMNGYVRKNMKILGMKNKKLLMFDLDRTLAESKAPLNKEMAFLLQRILSVYDVDIAIISGCKWEQMETQFLKIYQSHYYDDEHHVRDVEIYERLYFFPTCGAQMYSYPKSHNTWVKQYDNNMALREKVKIFEAFHSAVCHYLNYVSKTDPEDYMINLPDEPGDHGEIAEDRGPQVTFSLMGQEAPLDVKTMCDPLAKKREYLAKAMRRQLKDEYEVRIGGTTSIDVTKKGIDKAFGVRKIIEHLHIEESDVVFVGDALFEGGNDYSVIGTGVECIKTTSPEETMKILKKEFFGE